MRKTSRAISLLLALCMALSLIACGQQSETAPAQDTAPAPQTEQTTAVEPTAEPVAIPEPEPFPERPGEIEGAIEAGLVPARLQTDLDRQVTFQEYAAMLDALVDLTRPEKKTAWLESSAPFRDSGRPITRYEGMAALLFAAECLEVDAENYNLMSNNRGVNPDADEAEDAQLADLGAFSALPFERLAPRYYNETIARSDMGFRCGDTAMGSYKMNAYWFAMTPSYGNGKTYFDFDGNYELHPAQPLTRDAAIRAVDRLYETAKFAIVRVPYDGEPFALSDYAKAQVATMPEVSYQNLPNWHGFSICTAQSFPTPRYFDKEYAQLMMDYGFDFCRTALDTRFVFDGNDTTRVSPTVLRDIDELIELCARNRTHVCLDIHEMVGFYTNDGDRSMETLFVSEATQEEFVNIWRFFAERYRDVPASVLSFNLLNEPHDREGDVTGKAYSALMIRAIDAIHTVTPNRLIFADAMGATYPIPAEGLAGQEVVQAIHYYLPAHTQQYPIYWVNERIVRENPLEFRGSFPAGTELTLAITGIDVDPAVGGALTLIADGQPVDSVGFDRPAGFREWFALNPSSLAKHTYTFRLSAPASVLRVQQTGGEWYLHNSITLKTEDYSLYLQADMTYQFVSGNPPVLTVAEDGGFTAEDPLSVYVVDLDSQREVFSRYTDFAARTGTRFMVQEIGFWDSVPSAVANAMAEDFFTLFEEVGMPWCDWTDVHSPVLNVDGVNWELTFMERDLRHAGGNYEQASEHYIVDTDLMEIFQRHMQTTPNPKPATQPSATVNPGRTAIETPGRAVIEHYNDPAREGAAFLDAIEPFTGSVERRELSDRAKEALNNGPRGLTANCLVVDGTPLNEVYRDDGTEKPLLFLLHGGGGSKDDFFNMACNLAGQGLYAVCIDAAGCGDSQKGPLDALACFAETVYQLDSLIEYYNQQPGVNAAKFGIHGSSMGGSTAFAYGAHGKYRPTILSASLGTPDYTLLSDGPLSDVFDHGHRGAPVMTRPEIMEFARRYSPINWPERFLDIYVFATNGTADEINGPEGCMALEQKLTELGGSNFSFNYFEGYGHEDLPIDMGQPLVEHLLH